MSESSSKSSEKENKKYFRKGLDKTNLSLIILKLVSSKRATNCSLKIDQRTDKREYPVDAKMTQEAFELLENFENWVLKFEVKTKTFSSLILNECDADGNQQQRLNLRV